ncbi:MAG: AAA family ATPase [Firmicutes bacterium]|nr:AAA family ATPase [Bacillota bacterium]
MALHIAVAGKGGTGKTTFAALAIKQLIKHGQKPILAVDADANANLNEALGIELEETIAEIIDRIKNDLTPLPAGMTKDQFVEFKVHQSLAEGDDVDLLSMGGPEGPGCYCYANNILRGFIDSLSKNYPVVVADNEAGLEHLSRRTTQNVDYLFVISDASARGIRSAKRVKELVELINLDVKKMYLVVTRVKEGALAALQDEIDQTGLELIGTIPPDDNVTEFDLHSKPLIDLPDDSPAVTAVAGILKKAGII